MEGFFPGRYGLGPYRSTYRDMPKNPVLFFYSNFYPCISSLLWRQVQVFLPFSAFLLALFLNAV